MMPQSGSHNNYLCIIVCLSQGLAQTTGGVWWEGNCGMVALPYLGETTSSTPALPAWIEVID